MNVCIMGSNLNPPFVEAQKILALELARGLSMDGHDVHVVTKAGPGLACEEHVGKIRFHRYPRHLFHAILSRGINRLKQKYKLDVLHNQDLSMRKLNIFSSTLFQRVRLPVVSYICLRPSLDFGAWLHILKDDTKEALFKIPEYTPRVIGRMQMGSVQKIVTSSDFLRKTLNSMLSVPESEIEVIHPYVDTKKFKFQGESVERVRAELGAVSDTPILLFIGTHKVLRGEKDFLEALSIVLHKYPDARGVLVTPSPIPRKTTRLVERFRLAKSVTFLSGYADVASLMSASNAYVFPGFSSIASIDPPLTAIEAMAVGTPCVAYDTGGLQELADGGMIRLVEPNNTVSLAEAITEVLKDADLSGGRVGSLEGIRFDLRTATRSFLSVYESVIEREP